MSLMGWLQGDPEDDVFMGPHLRNMRQMSNMMNSLFADPFRMFDNPALTHPASIHNPLMSFGFPAMPNMNRLLSTSLDSLTQPSHHHHHHSFSSSTVVSMTSGPDGRPQVYKATSSTRCAPGGIKETQQTVSDTRTGTKKMAIGHHIGDRAHIIEREQNMHSGDQEERQDFINIEEDDADEFNREWQSKARGRDVGRVMGAGGYGRHSYGGHVRAELPAITAGPSSSQTRETPSRVSSRLSPRRSIRASPLTAPSSLSSSASGTGHRRPYSPPGHHHQQQQQRKSKNIKTVSGGSSPTRDA